MTAIVLRGDARHLPLPDECVDLIVTSPPYFGLRSYTDGCPTCSQTERDKLPGYIARICPACGGDGGNRLNCRKCGATLQRTEAAKAAERRQDCPDCGGTGQRHYAGQIGSEATPQAYLEALWDCTREWIRVLKPGGNLFVELGDKYAGSGGNGNSGLLTPKYKANIEAAPPSRGARWGLAPKSLLGLPWRYANGCVDHLGLILRRDIIWHHVNGLPESVTDRCRSAHSYVFHFTRQPRYYAAVDEIREPHMATQTGRDTTGWGMGSGNNRGLSTERRRWDLAPSALGKLPGSVWSIPSAPLQVPAHLGIDHFAAFPPALVRPLVLGWSPPGVCTGCGEGRRPVVDVGYRTVVAPTPDRRVAALGATGHSGRGRGNEAPYGNAQRQTTITGYACACPQPSAPTRPAVCLDPFGGTGTTALVASTHGRVGITLDRSADYCRLAAWRVTDPGERARARDMPKPPPVPEGMEPLFTMEGSS